MKHKAIFFDLDDTLYDQLQPFKEAVHSLEINVKDVPFEEVFKRSREYSDILWNQYCNNEITLEELRVNRLVLAFDEYGLRLTEEQAMLIQDQYETRQNHIQLFDYSLTCIQSFLGKGYYVGLITNGPVEHQQKKIKSLQLDQYIPSELIFISDAVGIAKPDHKIFTLVSTMVNVSPDKCYYVGDSWRNDVAPPLKAGWNSIWFNYRDRRPETNDQPYKVFCDYFNFEI